jgi:hypothetical protein
VTDHNPQVPKLVGQDDPDQARSSSLPASSLPWAIQELEACFVVTDRIGQKIAFVYFAHEAERQIETKLFNKEDARRIAANVAKLPELLQKERTAKIQ